MTLENERNMMKETKPKYDGRWNGYYIEASQEAYDKLVSEGYESKGVDYEHHMMMGGTKFMVHNNNIISTDRKNVSEFKWFKNPKPFFLVNGEFTETKPTISITAEDGTIYEFEKTKDIKKLGYLGKCHDGHILKVTTNTGYSTACIYNNNWEQVQIPSDYTDYKKSVLGLTPIKKAWNEDEANFPALMYMKSINLDGEWVDDFQLVYSKEHFEEAEFMVDTEDHKDCRLATKAERDCVYCEE